MQPIKLEIDRYLVPVHMISIIYKKYEKLIKRFSGSLSLSKA